MLKIRLVTFYEAPNCWDITVPDLDKEIDEQLEEYVCSNIDNITAPGFEIEDFEVPDSLDRQLVLDICNGKSMGFWTMKSVDFNNEMYLSWIFCKNKKNAWTKFITQIPSPKKSSKSFSFVFLPVLISSSCFLYCGFMFCISNQLTPATHSFFAINKSL